VSEVTARIPVRELRNWIAATATAIAYGMAVVTQDQGFPDGISGLAVIHV
jgi:predicted nucleic acid-binding protein